MTNLPAIRNNDSAVVGEQLEEIAQTIDVIKKEAVLQIAEKLYEAKKILKGRRNDKGFHSWVSNRVKMSIEHANRLVKLYERQLEYKELASLGKETELITGSALVALATVDNPDKIIAKVEELIANGKRVNEAKVRELNETQRDIQVKLSQLETRKAEVDKLTNYISELEHKVEASQGETETAKASARAEIEVLQAQLRNAQGQVVFLEGKLNSTNDLVLGNKPKTIIKHIDKMLRADDAKLHLKELLELIPEIKIEAEKSDIYEVVEALQKLINTATTWKDLLQSKIKPKDAEAKSQTNVVTLRS